MTHGTRRGYDRHRRAGEPPCDACREANNAHSRIRWRRTHPIPDTVTRRIVAVVEAHQPVALVELAALIPDANPDTLRVTTYRLLREGRLSGDSSMLEEGTT